MPEVLARLGDAFQRGWRRQDSRVSGSSLWLGSQTGFEQAFGAQSCRELGRQICAAFGTSGWRLVQAHIVFQPYLKQIETKVTLVTLLFRVAG
jgi:hypothetical protein